MVGMRIRNGKKESGPKRNRFKPFAREYNIRQDRLPIKRPGLPNTYESGPLIARTLSNPIANRKKACYAWCKIMKRL
jgi:hypothetical protein